MAVEVEGMSRSYKISQTHKEERTGKVREAYRSLQIHIMGLLRGLAGMFSGISAMSDMSYLLDKPLAHSSCLPVCLVSI